MRFTRDHMKQATDAAFLSGRLHERRIGYTLAFLVNAFVLGMGIFIGYHLGASK